jgi:hypothetical protein
MIILAKKNLEDIRNMCAGAFPHALCHIRSHVLSKFVTSNPETVSHSLRGACQQMHGKLSGCKPEEQQAIVAESTCLKQQQQQQRQLIHSSHLQQVSDFRMWYESLID